MKVYAITAAGSVSIEGQLFESGDCIGSITTTQPIDNVLSLLRFGTANVTPTKSEPKIAKRANVGADMDVDAEPIKEESKVDPDALNALDEDDAPAPEPKKAKEAEPPKEPEMELDASFSSLDKKWAKALTVHGLTSRDEVAKFVNEGGDLKEVDGIGNKTKTAIEAWLK